jgi:hypothetical protein
VDRWCEWVSEWGSEWEGKNVAILFYTMASSLSSCNHEQTNNNLLWRNELNRHLSVTAMRYSDWLL